MYSNLSEVQTIGLHTTVVKKEKKQNKFKVPKVKHYSHCSVSENHFITTNRFSKCKFIHQNVIPLPFNRQYYDYDVLKILFITEQVLASCNNLQPTLTMESNSI